jgi:hypothetical protein
MPFDSTQIEEPNIFRQRREKAAALWRKIPKNKFRMKDWECGSTACALGWLAIQEHDGWSFGELTSAGRLPITPNVIADVHHPFDGAALYFGISIINAKMCFNGSSHIYRRLYSSDITPNDVAKTLLSLPYQHCDGSPLITEELVNAV